MPENRFLLLGNHCLTPGNRPLMPGNQFLTLGNDVLTSRNRFLTPGIRVLMLGTHGLILSNGNLPYLRKKKAQPNPSCT